MTDVRANGTAFEAGVTVYKSSNQLPPPADDTHTVQRTIMNIHAIAKHLLDVKDDKLVVSVQPMSHSWRVKVAYEGFQLNVEDHTLSETLDRTLGSLMSSATAKLEKLNCLIAAVNVGASDPSSLLGVEQAMFDASPLVERVEINNTTQPGVAEIQLTLIDNHTQHERDQACLSIGAALERVRPVGVVFETTVVEVPK